MPEIEEEVIGSHTEETLESETNDIPMSDVYAAFGIEAPKEEVKEEKAEEEAPAIEQKPEPKTIKVKVDKEEREFDVSEDKLPEYVQKAYALDRERERKAELERNLDRAAKLAGFENHAEFVANFEKLEQQRQQQEQDAHKQLIADLRQQAEEAGLDPDQVQTYLDNHPLVKAAQKTIQEGEKERLAREEQAAKAEARRRWDTLYEKYPDLIESSRAFDEGKAPDWFNAEMQNRIQRGYDPLDAYELANRDKITAQTRRATEQKVIKQQQLGLRSQVETVPSPDNEPQVPPALAAAFAAFDLPVSAAQKYVKK